MVQLEIRSAFHSQYRVFIMNDLHGQRVVAVHTDQQVRMPCLDFAQHELDRAISHNVICAE